MKRIVLALLMCVLLLYLVGCGGTSSTTPNSSASTDPQGTSSNSDLSTVDVSASSQNNDNSDNFEELLNDISVEMEIDQTLSQAIVTITNSSPLTFDANVHVRFKNASGKLVGNDTIFVEELTAGNRTYARINISETDNIEMTYSFGNYDFTEGYASDSGVLDEDASAALAEDFEISFGGGGNPEWATSWYGYVTKIGIFTTDSNRYAVIAVSSDADSESIDRIGNTIFANYSKDHELMRVLVVDEEGNTVFDRSR